MINYSFSEYDIQNDFLFYFRKREKWLSEKTLTCSNEKILNYFIPLFEEQKDNYSENSIYLKLLHYLRTKLHKEILLTLQKKVDVLKKVYELYDDDFVKGYGLLNNQHLLILLSLCLLQEFELTSQFSFLSSALKINDFLVNEECASDTFPFLLQYEVNILRQFPEFK